MSKFLASAKARVMRSVVALESRRAQASASSIIMSATVSVVIICAKGLAFSNQGGTASCFFLAGRSVGDGFGWTLGKGKAQALCAHTSSFPLTSISFLSFDLRGAALSESPLSPWSWMGLSCQGPVCPYWSLQVPRRHLKIQGHTSHTPCCKISVQPCCI